LYYNFSKYNVFSCTELSLSKGKENEIQ
jgi:hypothetical protein